MPSRKQGGTTKEPFDILAYVVFQLGRQLITDEFQALLELVKNSYDADASRCLITVRIDEPAPAFSSFAGSTGFVCVSDTGTGMDASDVRNHWLTISSSPKRRMKERGELTAGNRRPLGDKGLGRLGVQRLGQNVELWSRKEGRPPVRVSYTWREFEEGKKLSTITAEVEEHPEWPQDFEPDVNTVLLISDLTIIAPDSRAWKQRFLTETAKMVTPFKAINGFQVELDLEGERTSPFQLSKHILKHSTIRYDFSYKEGELTLTGHYRLDFFKPTSQRQKPFYRHDLEADGGRQFRSWLQEEWGTDNPLRPGKDGWYLVSEQTYRVPKDSDLGDADPGPFSGSIYSFDLRASDEIESAYYGSKQTLKQVVNELAGVRAYRDGFEVHVGRDWFNLSRQFTSGSSFYGLRPNNVLGHVDFSVDENAALEEVTDRQGFIRNAAYRRLEQILDAFVDKSGYVQGKLRRYFTKRYQAFAAEMAETNADQTAESIAGEIKNNLNVRRKTKPNEPIDGEVYDRIDKKFDLLEAKLDENHEKMKRYVALAGLGVTAEALTHEIENVIKRLRNRAARDRRRHLSKGLSHDDVLRLLDELEISMGALEKQLSFLAPSLSNVREKTEVFELKAFLEDFIDFWQQRSEAKRVTFRELQISKGQKPGLVHMSKGRLMHVLDNLVLNAVFWAQQDSRSPWIEIELDGFQIYVKDSGPGIAKRTGANVFEPFYSERGGRGMGLYIARELLKDASATIELGPLEDDRYRGFQVNLWAREKS